MNLFDRQTSTRHPFRLPSALFVLALAATALVMHAAVVAVDVLLGGPAHPFAPSITSLSLVGTVWAAMLAGCLFRWQDVRAGGIAYARRLGAVRASGDWRHEGELRLLNAVAEMVVTSSLPGPAVFVLRDETSINAFVLGSNAREATLVVTAGALAAFDHDELQAVVAHELGHVARGDLASNTHVLVALGGLDAIDAIGRSLLGEDPRGNFHPGVPFGALLCALGSIGVLCGDVLKAATSRRRELRTDAWAVKLTRKPWFLASALAVVENAGDAVVLHSPQARALAHLCFSGGKRPWYGSALASHPPLRARIDAIDPHFEIKRRLFDREALAARESGKVAAPMVVPTSTLAPAFTPEPAPEPTSEPTSEPPVPFGIEGKGLVVSLVPSANATVSPPTMAAVSPAEAGVDRRPRPSFARHDAGRVRAIRGPAAVPSDRVMLLLADERSCLAALFALFAGNDPAGRDACHDAIARTFDPRFAGTVRELSNLLQDELRTDTPAIIAHATGLLGDKLKLEHRRQVLRKLETLGAAGSGASLTGYATIALIRRKLGADFPVLDTLAPRADGRALADGRRVKTCDAMGGEFALLLALMIEDPAAAGDRLDIEFERVLRCYTDVRLPRRVHADAGVADGIEPAFQALYVQPKPIRQTFIGHCTGIVLRDAHATRDARARVELFAAALDCEDAFSPAAVRHAA